MTRRVRRGGARDVAGDGGRPQRPAAAPPPAAAKEEEAGRREDDDIGGARAAGEKKAAAEEDVGRCGGAMSDTTVYLLLDRFAPS